MKILVTGSAGLIGGEAVEYFGTRGHQIYGIDNNMRREFFGEDGDALWNLHRVAHPVLGGNPGGYVHHQEDIRDAGHMNRIFEQDGPFDAIIHCAAQPSHDKSREIPLTDFEVNALGTMNLLEATRQKSPRAVFVFMSTNKVYGDAPNERRFVELETRWEYADDADREGIDETCRIDRSTHSVFGASKVAADIMVQEYGRYFGLRTCVLRGGCLTGPGHSGVELHGFLSYLVRVAVSGKPYRIYGYKGKQVRDNIHSLDVMRAIERIIEAPRPGEAYNIGGGRENSISVLEAIAKIEKLSGRKINWQYVDEPRVGDHICYISDMRKFKAHHPEWGITKSLDDTIAEMIHEIFWGKYRDCEETRNYPLTEDSLVWDVGGWLGSWAASIAEKYNPYIWIFEPVAEFAQDCRHRFTGNEKVRVFQYGLSDRDGKLTLAKHGQNSSLFRGGDGQERLVRDPTYGDAVPETIEVRDVLGFLPADGRDMDLISINAEGAEFEILKRLLDTGEIRRFRFIQVQFHSFHPDAGRLREEIRRRLRDTHVLRFDYPFVWESWERIPF